MIDIDLAHDEYDLAAQELQSAIQTSPADPELRRALGEVPNLEEARKALKKLL